MPFYDEQLDLDILKPYFSREELAAPNGEYKLANGFAENLMRLRIRVNHAMIVNSEKYNRKYSGCRTLKDVNVLLERGFPASRNSFHLIDNPVYKTNGCAAIDVLTLGWSPEKIQRFINIAREFGWSIGLAKSFIHIDRRSDYTNLRRVDYAYEDTRKTT